MNADARMMGRLDMRKDGTRETSQVDWDFAVMNINTQIRANIIQARTNQRLFQQRDDSQDWG